MPPQRQPQVQFEAAPLKLICAAPRPSKRSYEEMQQHANPAQEIVASATQRRSTRSAVASGKVKAATATAEAVAPTLAPASKRARLGAWVTTQRQRLMGNSSSMTPEPAEALGIKKHPLAVIITDWFSSFSSRSQAIASKLKPVPSAIVHTTHKIGVRLKALPAIGRFMGVNVAPAAAPQALPAPSHETVAWSPGDMLDDALAEAQAEAAHELSESTIEAQAEERQVGNVEGAWQMYLFDEEGTYYYHNSTTGLWQWEVPVAWQ